MVGCTEPAGIAYAFSAASRTIRKKTRNIDIEKFKAKVELSHDVYRNASTVRVPVIRKKGIKAAATYGILKNGNALNIFSGIKGDSRKKMNRMINKKGWFEELQLKKRGIYIKAELEYLDDSAAVYIEDRHDNVVKITCNGKTVHRNRPEKQAVIRSLEHAAGIVKAKDKALERIAKDFILSHGHNNNRYCRLNTIAAVDKLIRMRMEGEYIPVATITGSGNQGIFLAMPFYELYGRGHREAVRAALFAILAQIYFTQKMGRISGECGLVNKAAPALTAGLSFYRNKTASKIKRDIGGLHGVLPPVKCTGAKVSCSLKASLILSRVYSHMHVGQDTV